MPFFQYLRDFFKTPKTIAGLLFCCWMVVNFLPFRLVTEITDVDGNPSNYLVRTDAGFEDEFLFVPQLFLLIPVIIMFFSKKKIGFLFSLIFSALGLIPLVIINFVINFKMEINPPYHSLDEGFGYALLCLLVVILFMTSITFYIKTNDLKQNKDELIDQLIG